MLIAMLLSAAPSFAYDHTGYIWETSDFPLKWWMDDDQEDTLTPEYQLQVVKDAWLGWEEGAPCAGISSEYQDTKDFGVSDLYDGKIVYYWEDPAQDTEPGVLGVTYYPVAGCGSVEVAGLDYDVICGADIVMNDNVAWATTEEIVNGDCTSGTSAEGVLTHETGHLLGMGHSCEQGEQCPTDELKEATMFWSVGSCDLAQADINEDDIQGITALYGSVASFEATSDRYGAAALTVDFEVNTGDEEITISSATWSFGDGENSNDIAPSHVYDESGQYSVTVDVTLESEVCGTTSYSETKLGYVLACEAPAPEEGASGFFQISRKEGLVWQTINQADVSVYGCVDTIQWEVYEGSSEADITEANKVLTLGAWSPQIAFPKAGKYVVVVNVGGPGGLAADYLAVEVSDEESGGCAVGGGSGGALAGLVLAGLMAAGRRRKQ